MSYWPSLWKKANIREDAKLCDEIRLWSAERWIKLWDKTDFYEKIKLCDEIKLLDEELSDIWENTDFPSDSTNFSEEIDNFEKTMNNLSDKYMEKFYPRERETLYQRNKLFVNDSGCYDRCLIIPRKEPHPDLMYVLLRFLNDLKSYDDKFDEIFDACKENISIRCRTRSLCAAITWRDFAKKHMSLSEFSKKTGIMITTIKRTTKKLKPN